MKKIVYLEWIDSCHQRGWTLASDVETFIEDSDAMLIQSVGYLQHEDRLSLTIVQSVQGGKSTGVDALMRIPKVAIKKRQELSMPKRSKAGKS